jgi:predicted PurR-regulated permease PerM
VQASSTAATHRRRQLWLTLGILVLAAWITLPFAVPLAWAAVLAIAEWPLFERASARHPHRSGLIALGFTLATALFVVGPLSLVATGLAAESQGALAWLRNTELHGAPVPPWLPNFPLAGDRLAEWWHKHLTTPAAAAAFFNSVSAGSVLGWTRSLAAQVVKQSGLFLVTLIALVSLLARGRQLGDESRKMARAAFGRPGEAFLVRLGVAVRRTVIGTLVVSGVEGSLIGVGYVVAGVPQALLFGVATVVLALVPFGAWAAFGLAGLILLAQGHAFAAVGLIAFGIVVMTVGDNVVQPAVIGGAVKLPFLLAFIGAFGGLAAMGVVGLFIGPVIMVALLLAWRDWTPKPAKPSALD